MKMNIEVENQAIDMILDDYEDKTIEQAIKYTIRRTLENVKNG